MSWEDLPNHLPISSRRLDSPVVASCNAGGRYRQRLMISVHVALLDGGCPWWVPSARVLVQIGRDDHAGGLRFIPSGSSQARPNSLVITRAPGRHGVPSVSLIGFPGLTPGVAHKGEALEFDHGSDWIEVTLPAWARPRANPADFAAPAGNGAKPAEPANSQVRIAPLGSRPAEPANSQVRIAPLGSRPAEPAKSQVRIAPPGSAPSASANSLRPPYRGISERVPDPAKAIQAQNGGRVR